MPLNPKSKQKLKAEAHALKPIIMVGGKGVTESLIAETERALDDHELIKAKFLSVDRDERKSQIAALQGATKSELIAIRGKIAILYRKSEKH